MNKTLLNGNDILNDSICGFHQYVLENPIHISYASKNLCDMLMVSMDDLVCETIDKYEQMVHIADRAKYRDLMKKISQKEQTLIAEYRLVKKDGTLIFVRDRMVSQKTEDGVLVACSVLTDMTEIKQEQENVKFLNETIPCGFLKYTCEKQPRITYMNQNMIDILRFPKPADGELDYLEMYKSNIFLMVPMEERRRFSLYLNRVYSADAPVAGEMSLLRCDGTRAYVFGWVTKTVNEQGMEEFQSVCMDITDRQRKRKTSETNRYLKALKEVYDKIFEFNLEGNTLKCLHSDDQSSFKHLEDIAVQIDDALEKWIFNAVEESERETIRTFFTKFCQKKLYEPDEKPPQIIYRARSSDGTLKQYSGIFIKIDEAVSFYCCRQIHEYCDNSNLRSENTQMKESVKEILQSFSDGIAAFEVTPDGMVKPLYASENVCEFFGYTKEEWVPLTENYTPIRNFVAYSEASYDEFEELLRCGEAEFSYFDYQTEKERKIKAICSQREANINNSRYIMLYSVEEEENKKDKEHMEKRIVAIRTFGYFDVFVGDQPIAFKNKKAKELLAILVDRRGGYITSEEAISYLWEDEPTNSVTLSRYRKVALRLKNTLEEYGISDIVESVDGKRRIVMEKVQCDLYQYLSGTEEYANLFKGSYLNNFSWAEITLGELIGDQE